MIFNVVLKSLREQTWLNIVDHVTGNHANCVHPVLVINTGVVRTQHNESTNSMIAQVVPKNKVFNTSNDAVTIGRK